MIITIRNTTRQACVYQLDQRVSSVGFKGYSETVIRVTHDAQGNGQIRRQRLRHGPVLRLRAGETREVPAAILHDPKLGQDTKGPRPKIKILRRETPDENAKRKQDEAAAAEALVRRREARAKELNISRAMTAPSNNPPDEKAGSEGNTGTRGSKRSRKQSQS